MKAIEWEVRKEVVEELLSLLREWEKAGDKVIRLAVQRKYEEDWPAPIYERAYGEITEIRRDHPDETVGYYEDFIAFLNDLNAICCEALKQAYLRESCYKEVTDKIKEG